MVELLRGTLCHINLIRLNEVKEVEGRLNKGITPEDFRGILENGGIPTTLRRELGSDIDAACGQLRAGRDI